MIELTTDNVPQFNHMPRWSAWSPTYEVTHRTSHHAIYRAITAFEWGVSNFKPSTIEFTPHPVLLRRIEMSRKPAQTKTPATTPRTKVAELPENKWKGFINVSLTDEEMDFIEAQYQPENFATLFMWLVSYGKVSLAWNPKTKIYDATMVLAEEPKAGYGVSARHTEPHFAIANLAYKIEHKWAEIVTGEPTEPRARRG